MREIPLTQGFVSLVDDEDYNELAQYKWCAYVNVLGRRQWLGYFDDERDAGRAYNAAAIEHFKEFALLNVI